MLNVLGHPREQSDNHESVSEAFNAIRDPLLCKLDLAGRVTEPKYPCQGHVRWSTL